MVIKKQIKSNLRNDQPQINQYRHQSQMIRSILCTMARRRI